MTTRDRIVEEALSLFAQKGYKGTSVKNIADAVGIKDSSLYKHYKSKQEILDTIIQTIEDRIMEMSQNYGLPIGTDYEEMVKFYAQLDDNGLAEFSKKIFLFYLKDDKLSKFWKMGMMEQFQDNQVSKLFRHFFLEDSIKYQTELFSEMIKQNVFIEAEPEVMAVSFFTPIFFLLSKYSGTEDKEEEALAILDKQVREFYRVYKKR